MTDSLDHRTPGAALHPRLRGGDPVDTVLTTEELERVLTALKTDTPAPAAGRPPTARGIAAVVYPTQEEGEPCSIP